MAMGYEHVQQWDWEEMDMDTALDRRAEIGAFEGEAEGQSENIHWTCVKECRDLAEDFAVFVARE